MKAAGPLLEKMHRKKVAQKEVFFCFSAEMRHKNNCKTEKSRI